eukprot:CAMPEP_0204286634 /NCGR_PEP_ID=MMETSP0468-20130131/53128_1 /ASSEMBLY_ACC=CAM_ASM_000383 /TAXON_ID=2969 /ORGANISM="Oxyrrhis marina" /LENGTH=100 /DNA_ID=CAMNT_0051264555 /DNA_START=284 /DNA_END=583 /DNA_ORIENTATION=-
MGILVNTGAPWVLYSRLHSLSGQVLQRSPSKSLISSVTVATASHRGFAPSPSEHSQRRQVPLHRAATRPPQDRRRENGAVLQARRASSWWQKTGSLPPSA